MAATAEPQQYGRALYHIYNRNIKSCSKRDQVHWKNEAKWICIGDWKAEDIEIGRDVGKGRINKIKTIFSPRGGGWGEDGTSNRQCPSCFAGNCLLFVLIGTESCEEKTCFHAYYYCNI